MPLYEWHCGRCDLTFEALATSGASGRKRGCPRCGRAAPRVPSVVARVSSGRAGPPTAAGPAPGGPDVTKLRVPSFARPCWMDDRSAARFAAYKHGRGAEYDETVAARSEARKKYGLAESEPHGHGGHSPLADPGVFERRAAAARKTRAAGEGRGRTAAPPAPK